MQINPDKYEKQGININYLANYENSITFIEVLKIIMCIKILDGIIVEKKSIQQIK